MIGSFADLAARIGRPLPPDFDPHKPHIDGYTWPAKSGKGTMRRVPQVIDTWFDSGSMPFAQWHFPFENRERFARQYPADFIAEGNQAALYLSTEFGGNSDQVKVVEILGASGSAPAKHRAEGFAATVGKGNNLKVIDQEAGDWTKDSGAAAMRKLFGLRPAPEFLAWLEARGIFAAGQLVLTDAGAHPLIGELPRILDASTTAR